MIRWMRKSCEHLKKSGTSMKRLAYIWGSWLARLWYHWRNWKSNILRCLLDMWFKAGCAAAIHWNFFSNGKMTWMWNLMIGPVRNWSSRDIQHRLPLRHLCGLYCPGQTRPEQTFWQWSTSYSAWPVSWYNGDFPAHPEMRSKKLSSFPCHGPVSSQRSTRF